MKISINENIFDSVIDIMTIFFFKFYDPQNCFAIGYIFKTNVSIT